MPAKHILACVDFSEQSESALRAVADYARPLGARITLLHVDDPQAFVPPQAVLDPPTPNQADVEAMLADLRDAHLADFEVELAVLEDHAPARAICDYAQAHAADLIVVGSHGRGGMERWLIGSVAERVIRHAGVNVLVVRH